MKKENYPKAQARRRVSQAAFRAHLEVAALGEEIALYRKAYPKDPIPWEDHVFAGPVFRHARASFYALYAAWRKRR